MDCTFAELVDLQALRKLISWFHKITQTRCAIFDVNGTKLMTTGWTEICLNFHRRNPHTRRRCVESDTTVVKKMTKESTYAVYRCKNGLIDGAAPIRIDGEHVATIFTGQVFFEEPNVRWFTGQARKFGFDERRYLKAVREVPIVQRDRFERTLEYLSRFAQLLGEMGLCRLKQLHAEELLREEESKYRNVFEHVVEEIMQTAGHMLKSSGSDLVGKAGADLKLEKAVSPVSYRSHENHSQEFGRERDGKARPGRSERLTTRQREIVTLIAKGYTTKEIAQELSLSVHTAEVHRMNIMERLNIHDVAGLVRYAIREGMIEPTE
ncbi:MAG: LuxR family transcriptional regulator [Syntrophorhabdales bacterium]|jgi:ligand-binding sensor protein/DNA-binding CsgD family transcriptional regulator